MTELAAETPGVGRRLARSTLWVLSGTVLSRAVTFAGTVVVARLLGREGFGELGVIQSTIATFQLFAGFGLGLTATKYVAELKGADPDRAGRIIGLSHLVALGTGAVAALLLAVGADWLARETLAAPTLAPSLRLAAVTVLLSAYSGSQIGALSGFEAFQAIARINVASALLTVPLLIGGVRLAGVRGAVGALALGALASCVLAHRAIRVASRAHGVRVVHRDLRGEAGVLWRFAIPAVLSGAFVQPVNWLCNALLVNQPNGYWEMGVFNAASQWRNLMNIVPAMLMQAVLPVLASSQSEGRTNPAFQRSLRYAQSLMVLFAFPLSAVLMFVAEPLLRLYGREFPGSGTVLVGCVAIALIQSIGAATGPAIEARGRMWFALAINSSWGLLYALLAWLGVARLGANALAYGQALSYVVVTVWGFAAMRRELPAGMLARVLASLALAAAMTGAAMAIRSSLGLVMALPAACVAAAIAAWGLADREVVVTLFRRARDLATARTR